MITSPVLLTVNPPTSYALVIGLSIGGGVIVLVAAGVLIYFFLFVKKKNINDLLNLEVDMTEPDFAVLAFSEAEKGLKFTMPDDNYEDFRNALLNPDHIVFNAFASVLTATDTDTASQYLIYIANDSEKMLELVLVAIETEINNTEFDNTIFRGNSLASKMFKTYSRLFGLPYIFNTLARAIRQLAASDEIEHKDSNKDDDVISFELLDINMELDDTKEVKEDIREENAIQLKILSEKLYQCIITSKKEMPGQFSQIFSAVKQGIERKFPGNHQAIYNAVGGLYFLRFVIPSIFAPHYYGLLKEPPTPTNQRNLVLLSKVLQSIANMVQPGTKEGFMETMSGYIDKKIGSIKTFYDDISKGENLSLAEAIEVPKTLKKNAIASLWNMFFSKSQQILEVLGGSNHVAEVEGLLKQYPGKAEKNE